MMYKLNINPAPAGEWRLEGGEAGMVAGEPCFKLKLTPVVVKGDGALSALSCSTLEDGVGLQDFPDLYRCDSAHAAHADCRPTQWPSSPRILGQWP